MQEFLPATLPDLDDDTFLTALIRGKVPQPEEDDDYVANEELFEPSFGHRLSLDEDEEIEEVRVWTCGSR